MGNEAEPQVKKRKLAKVEGQKKVIEILMLDIMGLPMGGENIKELASCAYDDPVLQLWKAHSKDGDIEQESVEDDETSNIDMDLQQAQREYAMLRNVLAYRAFVKLWHNKIVSERMNLEKALNDGLENFPDNGILKEWLNKKRMFFNEDDEIMDDDLDENLEDGDDVGKNDEGDKGEKDKDIESNIAEHVTTGGMASNVNGNGECADYSATQFLEDATVLEQVLDVLDKTSEKYYEGHVSGSGKMEGKMDNESCIGNVTSMVLNKGKNILSDIEMLMRLMKIMIEITKCASNGREVFFPTVEHDNYYLFCFDLRKPFY
ncbi:hypothetical protein L1887_11546 [Cichorium endivia]|nr:hypothetical protein L1887_11546 [Cichorium endivia]